MMTNRMNRTRTVPVVVRYGKAETAVISRYLLFADGMRNGSSEQDRAADNDQQDKENEDCAG
jgi:hypothetical protein